MRTTIKLLLIVFIGGTFQNIYGQIPSYIPTQDLSGWYPFNGNPNDESGNGNNGIDSGATLTTDRFGSTNSAYYFNGINNYINCGTSTQLSMNQTTELSVSVWIYISDTLTPSYARAIFGKALIYNPSMTNFYAGVYGNSQLDSFTVRHTDGVPLSTVLENTNNFYNQWINYVFVFKTGINNSKLYRNGQLVAFNTQDYNPIHTTSEFRIGGFEVGGLLDPIFFWGKIDDVGIWNRELTPNEIMNIYTGQTVGLENSIIKNQIKCFPNPTNGLVTFLDDNFIDNNLTFMKVINSIGNVVEERYFENKITTIDLSKFGNSGLFIIQLTDKYNYVNHYKVVIEKTSP
jgi:hypothetical protein